MSLFGKVLKVGKSLKGKTGIIKGIVGGLDKEEEKEKAKKKIKKMSSLLFLLKLIKNITYIDIKIEYKTRK